MKLSSDKSKRFTIGFSLPETMIAAAIGSFMFAALHACFAAGFASVKATREHLRATQVVLQRLECMRLCTFDQLTNTVINPRSFTDHFDNSGSGSGVTYNGTFTTSIPASGTVPEAYRTNMMLVTVAASWTSGNIQRNESMQTYVTRDGIDNYVVNGR